MKFVIFDNDGTLANTKKVDGKCFMSAFEQTFGLQIWNQKWEDFKHVTDWGITEEIIQREWGRKPLSKEYEQMISHFMTNLKKEIKENRNQFDEVPGAKKNFNELKKVKTLSVGIATGSWEKPALLKLKAVGIDMDGVCFSNSNFHKSRDVIVQNVINLMTLKTSEKPEKIIYVGDGEWDFKTCQNLGIEFIGIDAEGDGVLRNLGAKNVFRDFLKKINF
ncbi:MAG: HAD family hydrolase [Flavobacteriaceae bacterium]